MGPSIGPALASPPTSPTPGTTVLRSASVQGVGGHSASGAVQIVRRGASHSIEFLGDSRIGLGNNDNLVDGTAVRIAPFLRR